MRKAPKKTKSAQNVAVNQGPTSLKAPNVLDTLKAITFSAQLPVDTNQTSLERLIHDLRSAANAFTFLVAQLASDTENILDERNRRKLNQLRQHDAMNRNCINTVITCLEKQISTA